MQSQREKQPFFKPLSTNELSKPSSLYESSMRQKTSQTPFQINRQKENENLQQRTLQEQIVGTEKLSSLHAKLQLEADKIRKWKLQTEIEIRQKDKKILEATQTVESLRKSILELQLQNESLSLKLQEEIGSREDILQRITATRDMCNLLKEHSARTEERLSKCETERTELKYLEKEHLKQFEDLSQKFSNLEITAREEHIHLTNLLNEERLEKEKVENEMKETIAVTEQKLKTLECQCEEKDIEIRDVRADLRKNEEKMHEMICMLDDYKLQLTTLQDDFNKKESLLCDSDDQLSKAKEKSSLLEKQINSLTENLNTIQREKETLQNEFKDSENNFNTQIECLTTELEECHKDIRTIKDSLSSVQDQLEKALNTIEEMKSDRDVVIMEKSELECKLTSLLEEKNLLESDRKRNFEKMDEMNSLIEQLTLNIADQKEQLITELATTDGLRNKIDVLHGEKRKLNNDIENMLKEINIKNDVLQQFRLDFEQEKNDTSCLNKEITRLSDLLRQEKDKLDDLFIQKRNLGDELLCLQQELAEKDKELNLKHKELEKSSKMAFKLENKLEEYVQQEQIMRSEIQELKANLEERLTEIESLKEYKDEQDKMLNGELENKAKEATALDSKVKNLKETVSSKTKQVKELEKEVRSLKSKLTSQTKETENRDKQLVDLHDEMNSLNQEKQDLIKQNQEFKCQADDGTRIAEEALKKENAMKKQSEKAVKDKEDAVQRCEHQIAEMMATLEKYQQENQKIVTQKDKEIEEMKHKIEQKENKNKKETNDTVVELNNKLQELTEKLSLSESDKVAANKKVIKLEKRVKKYENDVSKMQAKINQLQEIVDVIKSKKTEHIGVQVELEVSNPQSLVETLPAARKSPDSLSRNTKIEKPVVLKPITPNIRVAPKTPQLGHSKIDARTPAKSACTPVLFKTPTGKSPSSVLKTPQRSILKQTEKNSCVKKRRVAFEANASDSDDSSSSELMEVEIGEIDDRYKAGQKNLPLHVRPSPKLKTPEINTSDDEDVTEASRLPLQRKPRGPPITKTPQQEVRVNLSASDIKENVNRKQDIQEKKPISPRTPNIRKTPNKPQGKFFKSSPKNRQLNKPKTYKEETWFDIDAVFGFED